MCTCTPHSSWLLPGSGCLYWNQNGTIAAVVDGVGYILALFGCVVLHEFGHALMAARYGIRTRDITLLPIGGVARLERMPEVPVQEFWVALAGPAVTLSLRCYSLRGSSIGKLGLGGSVGVATGGFLERIMLANVYLVGFNLLPAFPMDGGRALRALLATRMIHTRHIARGDSRPGYGDGVCLHRPAGNPILLFIALFVWIGAGQEASMTQMKAALAGIPLRRAMLTHFRTLSPTNTLGDAVDLLLTGSQQDFPVVANGRVEGILSRRRPRQSVDPKRQERNGRR